MKYVCRFLFFFVLLLCACFLCQDPGCAEEITILFSGDTHAMLYPCNCPKEPDGGIARRATLIAQLRKNDPELLLFDCGAFFAGGLLDEYTQNTDLDKLRTAVNLEAMRLMKYDTAVVSADEFNFGRLFLEESIKKAGFSFLSSDIESDLVKPYTIKEIKGIKVGIIGLTGSSAAGKSGGMKFTAASEAVKKTAEALKIKGADIVILVNQGQEEESLALAKNSSDIDILICSGAAGKTESIVKRDNILITRPSWQARRLGKLSLTVDDGKIIAYNLEELRLSDQLKDDPAIQKVLPACFSDADCKKEGLIGACSNAGTLEAKCLYSQPKKIASWVIVPEDCRVCKTEPVISFLKKQFPGLDIAYLHYPGQEAEKIIKDTGIKFLPAYLLSRDIDSQAGFAQIKNDVEEKNDYYLLSPRISGIAYFLDREKIEGRLDLFISLHAKDTAVLLDQIKSARPALHFLAVKQGNGFEALRGNPEVEEYLRCVCAQKHYPDKFWDYLSCRAKNIGSSWWEDCAGDFNIEKMRSCARSAEGVSLLEENISLNKELQIMLGPTYLLDNQQIFSSNGVPSKEELDRILNK